MYILHNCFEMSKGAVLTSATVLWHGLIFLPRGLETLSTSLVLLLIQLQKIYFQGVDNLVECIHDKFNQYSYFEKCIIFLVVLLLRLNKCQSKSLEASKLALVVFTADWRPWKCHTVTQTTTTSC